MELLFVSLFTNQLLTDTVHQGINAIVVILNDRMELLFVSLFTNQLLTDTVHQGINAIVVILDPFGIDK